MNTTIMERIRELCEEGSIIWSHHVAVRCQQRGIKTEEIENCIMTGEVIEEYPNDFPYYSYLILGISIKRMHLHVVCGIEDNKLWIITAYSPNEDKWEMDFKTRKEIKL